MSQIVSKEAANASGYLFVKEPSKYVPFKGDFPIVKDYQRKRWEDELYSKMWMKDCSEWFQETVAKANRMEAIEQGFIEYLRDNNKLMDFEKLKSSEKADLLLDYMNKNCMDIAYLNIQLSETDVKFQP